MGEQEVGISEERKAQIGSIVFQDQIDIDKLGELAIQEILFSIKVYEHYHEQASNNNFEKNYQVLRNTVVNKLVKLQKLFFTLDKTSGFPFINGGCLDIYSEEAIAASAVDHYAQNRREQEVVDSSALYKDSNLADYLNIMGIERLRVDMGAYSTELDFKELFDIEHKEMHSTVNPKLRFAMIEFIQEAGGKKEYRGKADALSQKEGKMIAEIKQASFLMPVILGSGKGNISINYRQEQLLQPNAIQFAVMKGKNGRDYVPLFTDWIAFRKRYNPKEWQGTPIRLKDIRAFPSGKGIVINPEGENIAFDSKMISDL